MPLRLNRRRGLLTLFAACIGLAAPSAGAQTSPNTRAEPIRIAMIEGLSGPFANAGGAVFRNLVWATERVNARGGVPLPGGARPLVVERFDSKGQTEAALSVLRLALDRGIVIVAQGNSSAAAGAIIDAVDLDAMRTATVRNLIATLKTHGRNHLLVVESGGGLPLQVRGVISRAQIERQLGTPISLIEVAGSFAELRQLLT